MKEYFVYQHKNLKNGKKYIGITKQIPENRWGANGNNYSSSPYFFSAIQKYGWENFLMKFLFSNLTKEEACEIEKNLIKENNTQDKNFGYNIMEGGEAPSMPKIVRERLSEALKGNKNGLGKPCSLEKRKKISDAQKGRTLSEEHRKKLSIVKKGSHHKTISDESKKKISDAHRKTPIYCEELDKVFPSIQECARQMGIPATNICAVCKGKHKHHKGFHFSYFVENI